MKSQPVVAFTYPRLSAIISTKRALIDILTVHPRCHGKDVDSSLLTQMIEQRVVQVDALGDVSLYKTPAEDRMYEKRVKDRVSETPQQIEEREMKRKTDQIARGVNQTQFLNNLARQRASKSDNTILRAIRSRDLITQAEIVKMKSDHGLEETYCHEKIKSMVERGLIERVSIQSDDSRAVSWRRANPGYSPLSRSFLLIAK